MNKSKLALPAAALCLASGTGWAVDLKSGEKDYGDLNFLFKAMHVLDAADNGYDPSEGTGYL